MGRDLVLYPTNVREADISNACDICLTRLPCHKASGEFLSQCGVYWDCDKPDDEPLQIIFPRPVPATAQFFINEESDEHTTEDRIRSLHYCTAGEFQNIDPARCDGSAINAAALAYCLALHPDTVVILYIS